MITRLLVLLLLSQIAEAAGPALERARSSEDLARFIFSMTTGRPVFAELLKGLESTNTVRIASYNSPIPFREIYGTIVGERFDDVIPYERGKHHATREICSFLHSNGSVCRYQITVYEDKDYRLMSDFLRAQMAKKKEPNKSGAANGSQPSRSDTNRTSSAAGPRR